VTVAHNSVAHSVAHIFLAKTTKKLGKQNSEREEALTKRLRVPAGAPAAPLVGGVVAADDAAACENKHPKQSPTYRSFLQVLLLVFSQVAKIVEEAKDRVTSKHKVALNAIKHRFFGKLLKLV